jgi:hypothetical protein
MAAKSADQEELTSTASNTVFLVNKSNGFVQAGAVIHSMGFPVVGPIAFQPTLTTSGLAMGESASGTTTVSRSTQDYWLAIVSIRSERYLLPANTGLRAFKQCNTANDGKTFIEIEPTSNGGRSFPVTIRSLNPDGSKHNQCSASFVPIVEYINNGNELAIALLKIIESLGG